MTAKISIIINKIIGKHKSYYRTSPQPKGLLSFEKFQHHHAISADMLLYITVLLQVVFFILEIWSKTEDFFLRQN